KNRQDIPNSIGRREGSLPIYIRRTSAVWTWNEYWRDRLGAEIMPNLSRSVLGCFHYLHSPLAGLLLNRLTATQFTLLHDFYEANLYSHNLFCYHVIFGGAVIEPIARGWRL